MTSGKRVNLSGYSTCDMGDHLIMLLPAPPCSPEERFGRMLGLPGAVLADSGAPGSSCLRFGLLRGMTDNSLAILLQSTSCQPHTLITGRHRVQKKSMFWELGSRVIGHSGTSGGSPKNCLVLLTMNWDLSGEIISMRVSGSPFWTVLIRKGGDPRELW